MSGVNRFASIRKVLGYFCAFVVPFVIFTVYGFVRFGSVGAAFAEVRGEVLYIEVGQAGRLPVFVVDEVTELSIGLLNLRSVPVRVVGCRSSCGCVTIEGVPQDLAAHGRGSLWCKVKPTELNLKGGIHQVVELMLDQPSAPVVFAVSGAVSHVRERVYGSDD